MFHVEFHTNCTVNVESTGRNSIMLLSMTAPEHFVMKLMHTGQICEKNSYTHWHDSLKNVLGVDIK